MNTDTHIGSYKTRLDRLERPKIVYTAFCGENIVDGMSFIGASDVGNPRVAEPTCMGCILVRFQELAEAS